MTRLDDVIANMPKRIKDQVRFGSEIDTTLIPGPSIKMNKALKGGFGRGRVITIWGPKSAGKSSFCTQMIADAQKQDLSCAYLDVEGTYEPQWGERLGINNDEMIHFYTQSTNQMVDTSRDLIKAGVDIIVIDSITALIPPAYMDDDEIKDFEKMGAIGADARGMSKAMQVINGANNGKPTTIFLVSQSRSQSKGMYWGLGPTGGQSVPFYSSQVIQLMSSESGTNTIEGEVKMDNRIINKPIGRKVHWTIQFNKLGPQGASDTYDFYYEGDHVGIDSRGEVLDLAIEEGVIERKGAWYAYEGDNLAQGRDNAVTYLHEHNDVYNEVVKKLYG